MKKQELIPCIPCIQKEQTTYGKVTEVLSNWVGGQVQVCQMPEPMWGTLHSLACTSDISLYAEPDVGWRWGECGALFALGVNNISCRIVWRSSKKMRLSLHCVSQIALFSLFGQLENWCMWSLVAGTNQNECHWSKGFWVFCEEPLLPLLWTSNVV